MSETVAETEAEAKIAENDKSAENQSDSMEELKFDDDDEKNVSVEDILGGKSLLMSDSEQELSPVKQVAGVTREVRSTETPTLSEKAQLSEHGAIHSDDEEDDEFGKPKVVNGKKISALVDSDSETEAVKKQQSAEKQVTKKKISALIDSESDEEEEKTTKDFDNDNKEVKPKNKKKFTLVDSDSEQEEISTTKLNKKNKKTRKDGVKRESESKKLKKKTKKEVEQDSNDYNDSDNDKSMIQSNQKHLGGLVDSDSEQSNVSASDAEKSQNEEEMEQGTSKTKNKKDKKDKPIRASAKKAMDEMQSIQSEQQRLHREMHISVPYHQPKRHTLQEFLNRRSISKPIEILTPTVVKKPPKNLKMSTEELEAYAKLMEERAKEASEFFKSESEDEENMDNETNPVNAISSNENDQSELTTNPEEYFSDDDMELKDNPGVMDLEFPVESNTKSMTDVITEAAPPIVEAEMLSNVVETETAEIEEDLISTPKEINDFDIPISEEGVEKSLIENNDFEMSTDNHNDNGVLPSTLLATSAIVTEVIDLPRIDINTLNITPPKPFRTPKPSEQLKKLIMEKSTEVSPSIKGDTNMVIDLETGDMYAKQPTGVDTLFQRLLKTREARKAKEKETVTILSTENGKLEISKVDIATNKETDPKKEPKPGAAYQQLKHSLKTIINQKRLQKKKEEESEHMKCLNDDDDDPDENEETEYEPENKPKKVIEIDDEENEICVNDEEEIEEYEEETGDKDDNDGTDNEENDEENSKGKSADESDDDSDSSDDEDKERVEESQRKNRIIRAFGDDSSDDEVDFLKTPKLCDPSPATATQLQLSATKLFDAEEKRTASDEENELLNLCSGNFVDTQLGNADDKPVAIISQMPFTQQTVGDITEAADELMELCSGAFETQKPSQIPRENFTQPHITKILSSDEEANDKKEDPDSLERLQRTKKFTKKMKKKKLGFSDDEDTDEEEHQDSHEESEKNVDDEVEKDYHDEDEEAEDIPQTFVDYDSEENEIVVEMTRKDRVMRASNFVENEAELSESEWGSADEDEKQMDKYDIELGDEDEFDQQQLRSELEQIHARKMLDQDIREVKKIQEMLFEDEELDGVGRQRQFKWKNVESGFTLDDKRNENGEGIEQNSEDEENEHMWRKKRFEREQLLLEKGLKEDPSSIGLVASPLTTTLANATLNIGGTPTGGSTIRKLNIVTSKKSTAEAKKNSPFLISKTITATAIQQQKNVRGSFLVRGKETLSKLAGLIKGPGGLNGDDDGSMFAVSVSSVKAKNFVFATLTEEEHESQKRKADELLNSSSETGINYMKKRPRIEPKREKCIIDQLL